MCGNKAKIDSIIGEKYCVTLDSATRMAASPDIRVTGSAFSQRRKTTPAMGRYVKHDYRDRYHDPIYNSIESELESEECSRRGPRGGVIIAFPEKLYSMLNDAEVKFPEIVGWQPHGRCFVVRQPKQFVSEVLPM